LYENCFLLNKTVVLFEPIKWVGRLSGNSLENQQDIMTKKDINQLFNLRGQTAVITGGGGVLGSFIASALAKMEANIAILDISVESADIIVQEIQAAGGNAAGFDVCAEYLIALLLNSLSLIGLMSEDFYQENPR
jgi:hypothetical protein